MRSALRYSLICVGIFALVYALLFAQNSAMTLPSLTAQFSKASYQTVWALIDGNYSTGNFGAAQERLDPANADKLEGKPAVIPGVVRLGGGGAGRAVRVLAHAPLRRARAWWRSSTITLLIFFLQAQGWSPQWLAQIVPLILLCFPTRDGVTAVVLLSLVTFAEYPFLFIRTGDTGGEITGYAGAAVRDAGAGAHGYSDRHVRGAVSQAAAEASDMNRQRKRRVGADDIATDEVCVTRRSFALFAAAGAGRRVRPSRAG